MKVVVCPTIFKVLYIQGGQDSGFLPLTVSQKDIKKESASTLPLLSNDVRSASGDGGFAAGGTTCLAPHEESFCSVALRGGTEKTDRKTCILVFEKPCCQINSHISLEVLLIKNTRVLGGFI